MDKIAERANGLVAKAKLWLSERPRAIAIAAVAGVPLGLLAVGGYLITTAVVFALISCSALGVLLWKMRTSKNRVMRKIYSAIAAHPLATDIGFTLAVYMASPGGIIGMLGAGIAAVVASGLLMLMPKGVKDETSTQDSEVQPQPAVGSL